MENILQRQLDDLDKMKVDTEGIRKWAVRLVNLKQSLIDITNPGNGWSVEKTIYHVAGVRDHVKDLLVLYKEDGRLMQRCPTIGEALHTNLEKIDRWVERKELEQKDPSSSRLKDESVPEWSGNGDIVEGFSD